jgi:hypothetical protein
MPASVMIAVRRRTSAATAMALNRVRDFARAIRLKTVDALIPYRLRNRIGQRCASPSRSVSKYPGLSQHALHVSQLIMRRLAEESIGETPTAASCR